MSTATTTAPAAPRTRPDRPGPSGRTQSTALRTPAARPAAPARQARSGRAPFALLVVALLAGGLVAMLLLNTVLAQGAFETGRLQRTSDQLFDDLQRLEALNAKEASAQTLHKKALEAGLVDTCGTQFVRLEDGRILGKSCVAEAPGAPAATGAAAGASSDEPKRPAAGKKKPAAEQPADEGTGNAG